jgi:high affinity Mn2+ porin
VSLVKKIFFLPGWLVLLFTQTYGQDDHPLLADSGWSFHFQFTGIYQGHPGFHSPYNGQLSLQANPENAFSATSTLYLGRKLWTGASLYFNPEMAGGKGISSTVGIAGFPNGETFRIGDPTPTVYVGRFFLRQIINLGMDREKVQEDDLNQVRDSSSRSRLVISFGKFGMADFFDNNAVSHDPRSDFMNWALMNNGAYDYAANTRGYTYGLVAEWIRPGWALRFGTALEPTHSNGDTLDFNYPRAHSENLELEKDYLLGQKKGAIRLLSYLNSSKAPSYDEVVLEKQNGTDTSLDVVYGKRYGGIKWGFGLSADQEISHSALVFLRLGWNDGKTATWAFAEIDNTLSAGIRIFGGSWKRNKDNLGLAILSNGLSSPHRNFLSAGGYGFMIGDGKLPQYGRENIAEIFYEIQFLKNLWGTLDYQLVVNPAYNPQRGPVQVLGARVHLEW